MSKLPRGVARSNKKKMSSDVKNLDLKPTSPIRHKASLAEETQEELTERILKELEADERRRLSESQIKEALTGDPTVSASVPEPKRPFWRSVLRGIIREEPADT